MCLTFFKLNSGKLSKIDGRKYLRFVIGFNRDEDTNREASPLDYHKEFPNILCGLDKRTGTTWMALNKSQGDFAVLTNYRSIHSRRVEGVDYESRGNLILEYVKIRDESIDKSRKMFKSIEEYEEKAF